MLNFPLTRRAFVAGTAATALALAGCSVEQPIEPGPAPADPADDNAPTEPVAAQSGVARTLTAAVAYEGSDPNPIGTSSGVFLAAGWHVFEGLYELNMHTYRAECGLAADAPVQIDDLEYEVTLREDTVFSDGSPLTSADVVNAFERNGESDLYGAFLSFITAVSAPDERTVRFKLNAPMGSVLQERLALVRVFPATLTDEELASKPVGSGPWCYETINAADGGRISFTANHRYTGPWPATCERMEWSVLLDDTRRTDELIDKDVMVMEAAPVVRAEELADAGATVEWVPGFNLPFLMFNCEKPPFDDVRVRQALLYAIDVDSLIGTYMAGHARAATSLLPDYFRHYHRAATVYSYDPEKARKLLAEAGVDELALALRANDNWVSTLAPAIAEDWKAVGVTAEVVLLDTTALFADLSTEPEPGTLLPFDVVLSPGDPSCFGNDADLIISWWYGDNVWTRARSRWATTPAFAEVAELLAEARSKTSEDEQQPLWNQCFDIIAAEVPLYPLFHRETATAWWTAQLDDYDPISATGLNFLGTTPMRDADPI
ncbi:ABC transporter substrate-binding protein [Adlercreutzia equolifaciens subsp. celatus]|uniref:ABC transporter substrate-binding protein n=1 Tax=Adlercreutzia equolifaciens subsp. celatus DSM 18785 TaxID=1121021 RepID=A0A3N0AU96_9ACTN|nr:ABC transporter substrate-binding protein [Adlercreutzia equolifaciens]MCP2077510.1 peptide/nickel transport system substrate-binding protein [Adlercreutzia equolifaciens subsp. celatus DSM 18785]RFT93380.1 ABC transporter substrate-binding protein [Adlercreutzia equolifaciens subsp. celatus]RNL38119.1 ABC transporter substrate-binding protein [Adlercreutzia equolifaciens subsp. celatus DSM 18785]BCS57686.1 ABC transporter substrate-binding protein [Adlercreutzia equolifaciens subsp. celatus